MSIDKDNAERVTFSLTQEEMGIIFKALFALKNQEPKSEAIKKLMEKFSDELNRYWRL